jgi:hypothetical protein
MQDDVGENAKGTSIVLDGRYHLNLLMLQERDYALDTGTNRGSIVIFCFESRDLSPILMFSTYHPSTSKILP